MVQSFRQAFDTLKSVLQSLIPEERRAVIKQPRGFRRYTTGYYSPDMFVSDLSAEELMVRDQSPLQQVQPLTLWHTVRAPAWSAALLSAASHRPSHQRAVAQWILDRRH